MAVTDHPVVGPVLTLGPGGVATGVGTSAAHVLPLTDVEARRFVSGLPVAGLLDPAARARLEELLGRVGALADAVPELTGLELNPVILAPAGIAVVDARVRVAPVDRDPLPPVRRL